MHTKNGHMVIALYRPKPGGAEGLLGEIRQHLPTLRRLGLATDRPAMLLRAKDGTFLEIFEWTSAEAVAQAHSHPEVQAMWGRFNQFAEYGTLGSLSEAADMFPHFEWVE